MFINKQYLVIAINNMSLVRTAFCYKLVPCLMRVELMLQLPGKCSKGLSSVNSFREPNETNGHETYENFGIMGKV